MVIVCVVERGNGEKKMCQEYPLVLSFSPIFSIIAFTFPQIQYFKYLPSWDGGKVVLGFGRMGWRKSKFLAAPENCEHECRTLFPRRVNGPVPQHGPNWLEMRWECVHLRACRGNNWEELSRRQIPPHQSNGCLQLPCVVKQFHTFLEITADAAYS